MEQRKIKVSDDEILNAYNTFDTLHSASANLNMTTVSLWRRAKKLGIAWKDKVDRSKNSIKVPTNEILEGLHPQYQTLNKPYRRRISTVERNLGFTVE